MTIKLNVVAIFEGPSPYAMVPVVLVDVQEATGRWPALGAGLAKMQQRWPHWISLGSDESGFNANAAVARGLVAWAKGALNSVRGYVIEAGVEPRDSGAMRVWLGYHDPRLTMRALSLAFETALEWSKDTLDDEKRSQAEDALNALGRQTRILHPDYQIRYVMQAAHERRLPVLPIVREARVWQVGWGANQQAFFETTTHADSLVGATLARNKMLAKQFLTALGAPVARHALVSNRNELREAARQVGWPCVAKPLDRGGGKGVSADLRSDEALSAAFDYAKQFTAGPVMVEKHIEGADHRLLVIGGRMVSAIRRAPSFVVGDGQRRLRQLIDELNAKRRKEQPDNQRLIPVVEDDAFHRHLATQGLEIQSVPSLGHQVTLRSVSNLSMGGYPEFVSDRVHPRVRAMAESIAAASGLNTIGLDYITTDIGRDWHEMPGAFVEINTTPGLDGLEMHPGRPAAWLGDALLGGNVGRIPVFCAVMTRADWLIWKPRLQEFLEDREWGGSAPHLVWANGMPWLAEGLNANQAAQAMLRHRSVTRAVIVAVAEELVRFGFPVDGVSKLAVVGSVLPPSWQILARKISNDVVGLERLNQLDAWLLEIGRDA